MLRRALSAAAVTALAALTSACSGSAASVPGGSSGTSGASGTSGTSGLGVPEPGPDSPPAVVFEGRAAGCGDVFAYRASADGAQFVTVELDRAKVGINHGEKRTFDLATGPAGVRVGIEIFVRVPREAKYCNDVVTEDLASTVWAAEAGTLTVEIGEKAPSTGGATETFRATVRIEGLRVVGPDRGASVIVPKVEMKDVLVGWRAG